MNSTVANIQGFEMQDVNAVEAALKDAKFCVVARRAGNAGATAFYISCKTGAFPNFRDFLPNFLDFLRYK